MTGTLAQDVVVPQPMQLAMDQGYEPVQGSLVAAAPGAQELSDFLGRVFAHITPLSGREVRSAPDYTPRLPIREGRFLAVSLFPSRTRIRARARGQPF